MFARLQLREPKFSRVSRDCVDRSEEKHRDEVTVTSFQLFVIQKL